MIELRSSRKLEEAYGKKVDNLLAKSFEETIELFRARVEIWGYPIGFETLPDSKLRIKIRCKNPEFKSFQQEFRVCYLENLARNLELTESEKLEFGAVVHRARIANNSAYPIYVLTKTRKILLGHFHSNQDMSPDKHYLLVMNNFGDKVCLNTVQLYML